MRFYLTIYIFGPSFFGKKAVRAEYDFQYKKIYIYIFFFLSAKKINAILLVLPNEEDAI